LLRPARLSGSSAELVLHWPPADTTLIEAPSIPGAPARDEPRLQVIVKRCLWPVVLCLCRLRAHPPRRTAVGRRSLRAKTGLLAVLYSAPAHHRGLGSFARASAPHPSSFVLATGTACELLLRVRHAYRNRAFVFVDAQGSSVCPPPGLSAPVRSKARSGVHESERVLLHPVAATARRTQSALSANSLHPTYRISLRRAGVARAGKRRSVRGRRLRSAAASGGLGSMSPPTAKAVDRLTSPSPTETSRSA